MSLRILNNIGPIFSGEAKAILDSLGTVDYLVPNQSELDSMIKNYDAIVCGLANNFSKDILDKALRLKVIATATTGLDHIDLEVAKNKGVEVLSLRNERRFLDSITGTAELALGLMIALARKIPSASRSVLKGKWERGKYCGHSLKGSTLGIVGLGRLGKMMAVYGSSLGMNVVFSDPNVSCRDGGWKKVSLEKLLGTSDYISIHVHLGPETEYMFDREALKKIKPGASIINTSRGKIVNESDIIRGLEEGLLSGYATDVLEGETGFFDGDCSKNAMVRYAKEHENVIVVPHIGGMTFESRRDTDLFIAKKLEKFISKKSAPRR